MVQLGTTSGWTENHSRFCSPLRKLLVSSFPELLTVQPKGGQRLQLGEENHLILILTSARHLLCRTWFLKYWQGQKIWVINNKKTECNVPSVIVPNDWRQGKMFSKPQAEGIIKLKGFWSRWYKDWRALWSWRHINWRH